MISSDKLAGRLFVQDLSDLEMPLSIPPSGLLKKYLDGSRPAESLGDFTTGSSGTKCLVDIKWG